MVIGKDTEYQSSGGAERLASDTLLQADAERAQIMLVCVCVG